MEVKVRNIISKLLELNLNTIDLNNDTDLIDLGLDSIKAIEMVVNVESEFNILFSEEELLIDNINTISKIIDIVRKKQI